MLLSDVLQLPRSSHWHQGKGRIPFSLAAQGAGGQLCFSSASHGGIAGADQRCFECTLINWR